MRGPARHGFGHSCGRMALAGCVALMPSVPARAQILPSGGNVAAGSASIIAIDPAKTVIVQQSEKAIINWQGFSVGTGASVVFQQPNSAAITLNRVTGSGASIIDGSLLANGQVWLVNGNGILMGQGSRIDVGGLIATTTDIADKDFMSGRYEFAKGSSNPDAAVINRGSIAAATGGSAILSGAHVANEGVIRAKLGRVVLGGANAFSVSFDGDNLIQYQIAAPVSQTPKDGEGKPVSRLVSNSGMIAAEGGQVLMTARAARNIVDNVINTTGIIQARSASVHNGEVVLDAGEGGTVSVAGTLDVSGNRAGESGGSLTVLGEQIAIADGARLDASGDGGGGQILIGGNLHGAGPLPNAQTVTVAKAAIAADATASGTGGTVAIFSSGRTSVAATVSAKGIAAGGTVETSGHDLTLVEGVRVDTSASSGATGLWLLDPIDVVVDTAAAANITASIASTNVSVTASNDITINAPIQYDSPNSLAFLAGRNLSVRASVQNSGSGDTVAVAGWDQVTAASAVLATPASYGNGGGSILIGEANAGSGAAFGSKDGATIVAASQLTLLAAGGSAQVGYRASSAFVSQGSISIVLSGGLTLAGGNFVANSAFAQIGHGGPGATGSISGDIAISAQGPVTLASAAPSSGGAHIGNGGPASQAIATGKLSLVSAGDILMGSGATMSAGGASDALVIAAAGSFTNQAGSAALGVSPQGRWLVFLNSPVDLISGGLGGLPFYNRPFNFSAKSYAPVTSAGNRFVYAVAPVLTVTANDAAKVYGAPNPALSATISGGLPGDALAGLFAGSPLLSTGAATGSAVGSYSILASLGTLTSDYNYGFQFASGVLNITPATLTVSLTGTVQKTYDGTAAATLSASNYSLAGLISGDSVTLNAVAAYDNKNAGTGKTVTAGGLSLSGAASGNYVLASPVAAAAIGVIDPAVVTASLTGSVHKTYDGTAIATLSPSNYGLAGLIFGDSVTLNAAAVYDNKNAGTGKTVTANGLSLSGAASGNYVLASPAVAAAIGVIDPLVLTASLTGTVQKPFDGTTAASLTATNYNLSGVLAGDNVSSNNPAAGSYDSSTAGTGKIVTVAGLTLLGTDGGNYILASPAISGAVGIITPAPISLLGNSFTPNGISLPGQFAVPAGGAPSPGPSDATADIGGSDGAAFSLGQSLSGGAQSSSTVLLDGLLRQVTPGAGGPTRSVPPYGQIFSSWGNEAFWQ